MRKGQFISLIAWYTDYGYIYHYPGFSMMFISMLC